MPAAMSKTQIQRFIRVCEDQGIKVTRTKKGLFIRFPDGTSTVQHFTNSDVRAESNQIARFRRAGMVHPNDTRKQKEELPAYITSGSITPKTRQRIIDYVASQGFPESVLSSSVVRDLNMDPGWANRALYHSGFRPGKAKSRKVGRPWYTPDDILCLKEDPKVTEELAQITVDDIVDAADVARDEDFTATMPESLPSAEEFEAAVAEQETVEQIIEREINSMPIYDEPTPEVEDIQFIDMRDSWTVDVKELLGEHLARMVDDRLSVLRAVGIDYEIRVWRTTT